MSSDAEKTVQRMDEALLDNCRRQGLFKSGDRVIAACSGGADSMALLLFLLRHRRTLEIEVLATHVNHGIRGETARRDADFVADFCRRNGVELFLYDAVQEGIEVPPRPSEDWARGLRYGWFDELAAREEAVIATAHTMSDQAETVLFRMARGTGLHGLTGIPPRRGCYVRPCLCLTRADTEAYCAALGQHYIQDETNDQDVYARNRIRHDAIPALQYANPAAERSIARLCRQMRALDDWLTGEAAALLQAATVPGGYDVTVLRRAEGPVLDAALHALVSPVRDAEEKYISLLHFLVLKGEGAVQLTPDVNYKIQDGLLVCLTREGSQTLPAPPQPFERASGFFPANHAAPLIVQHRQVTVRMQHMAEMVAEHRLAGGAHRKALLQRVAAAGGDPGDLGRKAVDQLALLLQQALGDEHRHGHVLMAGGLEAGVQIFLDVFPDGVAIGAQHNKALDAGILDQLGLRADVGVPLGEVDLLSGDRLDHFFLIVCHFSFPHTL